ncbi:hypothetical protein ACLBR5_26095 [Escherichia coli]
MSLLVLSRLFLKTRTSAGADLDVDGKLQINANKDWVFDNDLQGRGIVEINMGNHEFSFDEFAYTDWFRLARRSRTRHLTWKRMLSFCREAGSLRVRESQVIVGKGAHSISTLGFSGGTVDFGALTAGAQMTEGTVNVSKTLDLRGEGVIQVSDSDVVSSVSRDIDSALSLTEVDDGNSTIKLVDAQGAEDYGAMRAISDCRIKMGKSSPAVPNVIFSRMGKRSSALTTIV